MTGKAPTHSFQANGRVPLWTRPFVFLMLQNLLFWVAMNMFTTTMPGYVLAIGGTAAQTGILVGLFSYAALLFRPASGVLIDRWERRKVLLAGTVLATAVSFVYPFATFLTGLMVLRFIHGLGFSAFSTASSTMAADIVPESRMSEGLGVFGLANTISMAIGPSIGLALVGYGHQRLFLVIGGLMVVSLILVFWIDGSVRSRYHEHQDKVTMSLPIAAKAPAPNRMNVLAMVRGMLEKSALRPSIVAFFMLVSVGSIMAFLPLYGKDRGFDNIGLFFTVYAGALILARFMTGRLADEHGSNIVFIPSLLLAIISTLLLAFANSERTLLLAAVFYGAGTGLAFPILSAILIRLAPTDRRGAANATFFAAIDIAVGTGSIAMGLVSQYWGYTAFFLIATVIFLISLVLYILLLGRLEYKTQERIRIEYCEPCEKSEADALD